MNIELLKKAGVDYDLGVKRFVGRAHLYEKVLSKFPRDNTFSRICSSYEAKDMEQLFASAHEFKGMCGNIALPSLYDKADTLVKLLRSKEFSTAELDTAYVDLAKEYMIVNNAVLAAMEDAI